ncbi:MAG: FRG domain-containing protein [SAR324 cluster bacterium]|uniref:FRG domain-containing protein n=1 Tax=SAR324 cluster bacterium TaxID=2024889 RepID=A0A7X9FSA9_9DELT|nr:FRG domain-containing protein [SAR324 cluster bacterium]
MNKCLYDKTNWEYDFFSKTDDVLEKFHKLTLMYTEEWGFRGQPGEYGNLTPSIERIFKKVDFPCTEKEREVKIEFEIKSVELFRRTLITNQIDIKETTRESYLYTLALLQHYNGVTRLLDWSFSPYVALYFAICMDDKHDGEIWSFEYSQYKQMAPAQWGKYPRMKRNDFTDAFLKDSNDDWFVCEHYPRDIFPRLFSQNGFFSMTSQFGKDHAKVISKLLEDKQTFHLYIIDKNCKRQLRQYLRKEFNIWHGSLYPDITGSGEGIKEVLTDEAEELIKHNRTCFMASIFK